LNLLVGGTGFVGGHVVEYLFQQGEISKGVFRMGSHLKIMDSSGVQGIEADLLDHHSLHEAMEGVDVVYSMASPMPGADSDFMKVNTEGMLNLLEVAKESKAKAFVHLSTLDVYGPHQGVIDASSLPAPSNDYQKSKAEADRLLLEFSKRNPEPRVVIIRAAKAVGSRDQSLVTPILRMASRGIVTVPSAGVMSFSHPRDIAQAMFASAAGSLHTGKVILLKSFDSTPEVLAAGIAEAAGRKVRVRKQGLFSSSELPKYTSEQLRAAARVGDQPDWKDIGYAPKYDLKGTSEEIAVWSRKEPWAIDEA
jgi:nucleoside-diphosphate-sugar epimerase